jgi:hypothetical protein
MLNGPVAPAGDPCAAPRAVTTGKAPGALSSPTMIAEVGEPHPP